MTHHIEEIGPWVQRVLLLRDGMVQAAGAPDEMITSGRMTELLDYPCSVFRQGAEYLLRMDSQLWAARHDARTAAREKNG